MTAFLDWQNYIVRQRRPLSGCIPTGYEFLLRAAGATDIDLDTFQDDFDLDKDRQEHEIFKNDFVSVALEISNKYPHICFKQVTFPKASGKDKLQFIEERIGNHRSILISVNMMPILNYPGCHIIPVVDVDMDETNLLLLYSVSDEGQSKLIQLIQLPKIELIRIHEQFNGGDDVAYLQE